MRTKIKDISQEQLEEIISKVVSVEFQKVLSKEETKTSVFDNRRATILNSIFSFLKICITTIIETLIGKWLIF
jgi:predicted nucleic acid-binding protein